MANGCFFKSVEEKMFRGGGGVYEQNGHKWIVMQYALVNSFQGGTNDFHKVGWGWSFLMFM